MKTKTILITLFTLITITVLVFQSCKKDEEKNNGIIPIANFICNPTGGTAPLTVNFTDQSTNSPTSWLWEFGDGSTSTQSNPSHTYNTDSSYSVSLSIINEYGSDTITKINYIYVGSLGGSEPCPGTPTVTDADGNVYNTVQIAEQCWMKENLRVGIRVDASQEQTDNNIIEKFCMYDDPAYCETYGGLYLWNEMMQYTTTQGVQGICPDGWHLPTDDEWKTMEMALGMSQSQADLTTWRGTDEGAKMKSNSGWNGGNGTNSSGLTALPAGSYDNTYDGPDYDTYFWSSTEYDFSTAWYRLLYYTNDKVGRDLDDKLDGYSVRCLKD